MWKLLCRRTRFNVTKRKNKLVALTPVEGSYGTLSLCLLKSASHCAVIDRLRHSVFFTTCADFNNSLECAKKMFKYSSPNLIERKWGKNVCHEVLKLLLWRIVISFISRWFRHLKVTNRMHRVKIPNGRNKWQHASEDFPCYSLARSIYINFFFVIILVFRIHLFLLHHAFNLRGIDLVEAEKTRLLHNGKNPELRPGGLVKLGNKHMTKM